MLTYKMLYTILVEAEARVKNYANIDPAIVERSAETVQLCLDRMKAEGITRNGLRLLARKESQ